MAEPPCIITIGALEKKHRQALMGSEKAICHRPDIYAQIKRMLRMVLFNPVDISEYYQTACRLAGLLCTLNSIGGLTIFDYFCTHIDPGRQGNARYFRAMCRDLADQIDRLDQWRVKKRNINIIK